MQISEEKLTTKAIFTELLGFCQHAADTVVPRYQKRDIEAKIRELYCVTNSSWLSK